MDRQPARNLVTLLASLDSSVAESALQPLERIVTRPGSSDALITAIVGASGVGKSEIVNALAGSRVVTVGPLRPTTTEIVIWGEVDAAYLPGTRISGPNPPNGVALVDTPAAEHHPDAVAAVLDRVDAVLFVVSPERYADAITATLLAAIRERGIPMRVVLGIGTQERSGFNRLAEDASLKLGTPIDLVLGEDVAPLRLLLEEMARSRDDLIGQRDRAAAAFSAIQISDVAADLEERTVASQVVVAKAGDAFARASVHHQQLAATADEEWEVAAPAIVTMVADAIDSAIGELADDVAADEIFSRAIDEAVASLPPIDRGPIDDWHRVTTDLAVASIKRRRLHPLRSRAVREEMWRLSIDFDRRPPERVRKALRGRLPDLRFDRGAALAAALRGACAARVAAFTADLDPSSRVSAADLRAAADAVAASGSLPGEVAADVT